jgi:hypothetical protein
MAAATRKEKKKPTLGRLALVGAHRKPKVIYFGNFRYL